MKALLLDAEWKPGKRLAPLTKEYPMCMFPVLNEPIIEHNIGFLCQKGITDVIITFSEHTGVAKLESIKEKNKGKINIHLHKELRPRGTAGVLKDVASLLGENSFFVMNSSLYIEDIDLAGLINFHNDKGAVVTAGVKPGHKKPCDIESIKMSRDGQLKEVHIMHHSKDRRSPWMFSGVYLFAPSVFDFIDEHKYLDIKEQLIPLLQEASLPVYTYEAKGYHRDIFSMADYFELHRDLFEMNSRAIYFKNEKEVAEDVWVGKDTVISSGTYLKGPIVFGSGCHIADRAQIIGPAVIGDGCRIAEDAIVRESILWNNVSLEKGARSEYCVVAESVKVPGRKRLRNLVAVNGLHIGDMNLIPHGHKLTGVEGINLSQLLISVISNRIFNFIKRTADIFIAAASVLIFSPVFVLIAAAIKKDSPGPVIYAQRRCGKHGKMFNMFKFRTMVARAEKMHNDLISQKDTDGPMFKMADDPRVTRLGKILRRTSLDELPQLFNVISGEMSLVGPRPLIMEEMKFSPSWRSMRLRVKPGLTGLWQVQGRSEAPFHDWIKYDVEYVMNQSLWMDIKILLKTIMVVLKKVGAH